MTYFKTNLINVQKYTQRLITKQQEKELLAFIKDVSIYDTLSEKTKYTIEDIEDFFRSETNTENIDEESGEFVRYFKTILTIAYFTE